MTDPTTRVVMLGTGTPVPDFQRAGAGVAVVYNDKAYVFDVGHGVVQRAIEASQRLGIAALAPVKRRGNRRYYRSHDIHTARRIRHLLYDMGFTIAGARAQLTEPGTAANIESARPAASPLADIRIELESILQKLEK